jgi:hypothetical protein
MAPHSSFGFKAAGRKEILAAFPTGIHESARIDYVTGAEEALREYIWIQTSLPRVKRAKQALDKALIRWRRATDAMVRVFADNRELPENHPLLLMALDTKNQIAPEGLARLNGPGAPPLRAVESRDAQGRKVTRYYGDPSEAWGPFRGESARQLSNVDKQAGTEDHQRPQLAKRKMKRGPKRQDAQLLLTVNLIGAFESVAGIKQAAARDRVLKATVAAYQAQRANWMPAIPVYTNSVFRRANRLRKSGANSFQISTN